MRRRRTFACAHCGADVSVTARACPECGSDDRTGWSEDAASGVGDLPSGYDDDEDFDYQEFLRAEGLAADGRPSKERIRRRRTAAVGVLLVIGLVLWLVWR